MRYVFTAVLVSLCPAALPGQTLADEMRGWNNQLLQLHAQAQRATPAAAAPIRAQAGSVIEARARALQALIRTSPAEALSLALSEDLLRQLAASFPGSAAALETRGSWRGPVEYLIADDAAMTRHRSLVRMELGGRRVNVYFAGGEPPELVSGAVLRAEGVLAGAELAAASATVEAAAPTCGPTGAQNAAVLLVTFPGVAPPSTVTPQSVSDIFFGPSGRSLDSYWREASYGKTWATGQVYGWFTLDKTYTCDDYYNLRDAAIRAADPWVDFRNYTRIYVVFPASGCSYAGLGTVGCTSVSSPGDGPVTASVAWLVASYLGSRDQGVKLAAHEGGHNLGLHHAASRDFGSEALGPLGAAGTLSEYGDVFSAMGSWNFGHYPAPHKLRLGWLTAGPQVQTVESAGIFSLEPIEKSPAGLQALRVRRGTGNNAWLWIESRQPLGSYDSTLPSQVYSGALIHYEDSTTGIKTHLLDFTPGTASWSDPALAAGKSWTDPYSDLSIRIQSATSSALTVAVNYGATPCVQANPSMSIAPANPSVAAGASVTYTVTVTNNDAGSCASSTFSLSSATPSGWASSFSAGSLTLSPGQSGTVSLTKTPPASTPPGTYAVAASGSDGARSVTAAANCTVTAPPPPLSLTLSTGASAYSLRSTVSLSAQVTSGSTAASGASVTFRLKRPNGSTASQTLTTDSAGQAIWSFKLNQKGTYEASATAAYGGQTASAGPVQFTVQ